MSYTPVIVHTGLTTVITVSLGYDVSSDIVTSQIRAGKSNLSPHIADWAVTFTTDGTDGDLKLTMDDSLYLTKNYRQGYMDMIRTSGGVPYTIFAESLRVVFRKGITRPDGGAS